MYKILALDMDGTVLNSSKKISSETLKGINRLLENKIHVIIASGRCLAEMSAYREDFKNMRYAILASGGVIYDFFEEKAISIHAVPFDDCLKIIEVGEEENAMIHLLTVEDSIARSKDIEKMSDFGMGIYFEMFDRICIKCEDIKKYAIENKEKIMKVNLYHRNKESRDRSVEKLKNRNLQLVFAESNNLEASPLNITKASGLIELCKYLNVEISETIAIGDAPNDIEILQAAGYSVAMGNADDEIKSIADFVTTDNDHDGVLNAINKIFFK